MPEATAAETILLAIAAWIFDLIHEARAHPRAAWALFAATMGTIALLLLKPGGGEREEAR